MIKKKKQNVDTLAFGFFSQQCTSLCSFYSNATMFDATSRISFNAKAIKKHNKIAWSMDAACVHIT